MPSDCKSPRVALIVDDFLVETAGIPRYCSLLLNGLEERGIDVQTICTTAPTIPYGTALNHVLKLTWHILRRIDQFDIVHATCPITALSFPLIRKRKVVTYHDNYSILGEERDVSAHARLLLPHVYRGIAAHSDKVIAHSTQTRQELMEELHIPDQKIAVINSGIDDRFVPLRPRGEKAWNTIGYLGGISSFRKRVDYLITAFSHLKHKHPEVKTRLVLCGDEGTRVAELRLLTESMSLSHEVEFTGQIPDEKLVETYNSFDVFVLPSEWEGFGFPILEAQRCGVPVIIREDARIPPEVAEGCLRAASEEDMADKIHDLLTNARLRQAVVDQGLEHSRKFTWDRTVQQTVDVYEELLAAK